MKHTLVQAIIQTSCGLNKSAAMHLQNSSKNKKKPFQNSSNNKKKIHN